jgi:hypothetical protein
MQTVNKETTLRYRGTPTRNLRTQQNSPPEKYSPYQLLAFQRAPLGTRLNDRFHGGQHVLDLSPQSQVGFHGPGQVLAAEFQQQLGRRFGAGRAGVARNVRLPRTRTRARCRSGSASHRPAGSPWFRCDHRRRRMAGPRLRRPFRGGSCSRTGSWRPRGWRTAGRSSLEQEATETTERGNRHSVPSVSFCSKDSFGRGRRRWRRLQCRWIRITRRLQLFSRLYLSTQSPRPPYAFQVSVHQSRPRSFPLSL